MSSPRFSLDISHDEKNIIIVATVHDAEGVVSQSAIRVPGANAKDFIAKLTAVAVDLAGAHVVVAKSLPKLIQ